MPFTLAHPLYAVPLRRLLPKLSVTGLALGSMAPDMEYFAAMQPYRSIGHSFEGFFLIGLPMCIASAFAYHRVIAPQLHRLLPSIGGFDEFLRGRVLSWRMADAKDWIYFFLSLFIGFCSHLFMDHWTHSGGSFVLMFPALQSMIGGYPAHHWQHSLSALGLAIPLLYVLKRWRQWRNDSFLTTPMLSVQLSQLAVTFKWKSMSLLFLF